MPKGSPLPKHVAIIMDGNGRWAKSRGLPRVMGHQAGIQSVRTAVETAREMGIQVLTLYAFSIENWKRSRLEVATLMNLLDEYLSKELPTLLKNQVGLSVIGRIEGLPAKIQRHLKEVIAKTRPGAKMILNLALNYGGRAEILDAVRAIGEEVAGGTLNAGAIDETVISRHLYTRGLPDPDLLIRTSGELRVSNFLLWQISYTELYITPTLWPDFKREHFVDALLEFQRRERRFGAEGT
ncbi:MAG: isoprenyl transferase [Candidatus Omnitrophica bacterium]|nr:isoprenyl transferase [Candidatus Omnitrophota bacterium]